MKRRAPSPKSAKAPETPKNRAVRPRIEASTNASRPTPTSPLPMATTLYGVGRIEQSRASIQKFFVNASRNVVSMPSGSKTIGISVLTEKPASPSMARRSEEHTSELQSRENLVCRLLLEKKKKQ